MKLCDIEGCEKTVNGNRALCGMHQSRKRRHGDPSIKLCNDNSGTCIVDGCDKKAKSMLMCHAHYELSLNNGDPLLRKRAVNGSGYITPKGYRVISIAHPVANAKGEAYEHRVVLYDRIGPGIHQCSWCKRQVSWEDDTLSADHIDWDRSNNSPDNIVASCKPCNRIRRRNTKCLPYM